MEKYIAPDRKRIPYGMMNFAVIRRDDCYYVDKTRFIPMIEEADKFFFFIRPRRFGKSLTVNMLQHYYDILAKDKFDALFGDLYIGKHPTRDRNSYLVLYLNFSGIVGELHNYRKGLDAHCQTMFDYFCDIYADYLPKGIKEELDKKEGAVEQFEYLFTECNKTNQRIYLFIDEYDHFTNAILSDIESLHRYTDETHGEGYLRAFFNKIKAGTYSSIERCFITGVSPVTMDDLTSGFNIGTNYSLTPEFNEMIGFTEEEVRQMLTYYSTTSPFNHSVDELIEIMKPWYDNYCFAEECYGETTMYNSNMVLYFVRNYLDNNGKAPRTYPGRFLHDDEKPDCAVWTQPGKRDTDLFGSFVFLVELCEEGQQQTLVFVVACKQLQAVALLAEQSAERDILAHGALEVKHIALLALEEHVVLALMDDLPEIFYLVNVLQFHNITSHVCFVSFLFSLCAQYTPPEGKMQD